MAVNRAGITSSGLSNALAIWRMDVAQWRWVCFGSSSEAAMIAAVLHDVVEDSDWTLEQLRDEGFSEEILHAVDCLTKREGETYDESISRVRASAIARQVKIADLEDNMNVRRIGEIRPKDLERIEKYHRHWRALTQET